MTVKIFQLEAVVMETQYRMIQDTLHQKTKEQRG